MYMDEYTSRWYSAYSSILRFFGRIPRKVEDTPGVWLTRASRKNATGIIPNWMVALPMKSAATNVTGICSASPTGRKRCTPDAANARSSGSILCCSNEKTGTDGCPFFTVAAGTADTVFLQFSH